MTSRAYGDQLTVQFNEKFFTQILHSQQVEGLTREKAEAIASTARATAPVDSGFYRDHIGVAVKETGYRKVFRVESTDKKTFLVESRTGNLARAMRANR